ncbi:MAG TPA: hypothetical protein H9831_04600 [Candidatus Eisenbergiella pullistercoris]|uniref:Uncharacterized protein n=1 Tax=Candidatus Eisenbergiella pullistercoris TaxID=2838555 RepID=A0A9D2C619_9FIRM|nr:hypothetical protein [Candidatus Eisenbergiella pullistercoris]
MEKLLFKKTLSDIQTADGFSDSCGFWFLCWHHYSRWEKGLQALQEFISENEKPNMTDHPVFLTADVWIPGKADIIEQIAWRKKTNEKMVHDSDNYAGHSFMCLSAENGPGNNACSGNRTGRGTGRAGPLWRNGNLQRISAAGRRASGDHGVHEN